MHSKMWIVRGKKLTVLMGFLSSTHSSEMAGNTQLSCDYLVAPPTLFTWRHTAGKKQDCIYTHNFIFIIWTNWPIDGLAILQHSAAGPVFWLSCNLSQCVTLHLIAGREVISGLSLSNSHTHTRPPKKSEEASCSCQFRRDDDDAFKDWWNSEKVWMVGQTNQCAP